MALSYTYINNSIMYIKPGQEKESLGSYTYMVHEDEYEDWVSYATSYTVLKYMNFNAITAKAKPFTFE